MFNSLLTKFGNLLNAFSKATQRGCTFSYLALEELIYERRIYKIIYERLE